MKTLIVVSSLFLVSDAYAYLDPGTGSFIIQSLVAAVLGAGLVVRLYFGKIKVFLARLFGKNR